ncbi:hypothetical protein ACJX0J_018037, partial [Zea mays]
PALCQDKGCQSLTCISRSQRQIKVGNAVATREHNHQVQLNIPGMYGIDLGTIVGLELDVDIVAANATTKKVNAAS